MRRLRFMSGKENESIAASECRGIGFVPLWKRLAEATAHHERTCGNERTGDNHHPGFAAGFGQCRFTFSGKAVGCYNVGARLLRRGSRRGL